MHSTGMAQGINDFGQLLKRCHAFRECQDTSQSIIHDLLMYCQNVEATYRNETTNLRQQLSDATLDLEDAKLRRRELQQQVHEHDAQYQQLLRDNDNLKNNNPYIAVLIDGDGLLFKDTFVRQGVEGGKMAAYALRAAIAKDYDGDESSTMEITAKVCANLTGLAAAMRRDGSVENELDMRLFAQGFSQSKASFDFVDVGYGKERADNKIKEAARFHLRNANCKLVVLGISHDAGYAPFLDELRSVDDTRNRIRIAEGFPTVRELLATSVPVLNLTDSIFRADKLVDRHAAAAAAAPAAATGADYHDSPPVSNRTSPSTASAKLANGDNSVNGINGVNMNNTNGINTKNNKSNGYSSVKTTPPPPSYAGLASRASPPPTVMLPLQTIKSLQRSKENAAPKRPLAWCPGPRGLDPPVVASSDAIEKLKSRDESNKLCNNMVLRGFCFNTHCSFNHNNTPSPDEKKALEYLTRLSPCTNQQYCEVKDCIYGHNCPSVRDGCCMQTNCRFRPDLHPPNTKFKPTYQFRLGSSR